MQLSSLHNSGLLYECPIGVPYPAGAPFGMQGWHHFAYETSLPPGGAWADASTWPSQQTAAFDWFFNTNGQGAVDVQGGTPPNGGTMTDSALKGGEQFYARTTLASQWGYAYHKVSPGTTAGNVPHSWASTNGNLDQTQTWEGLKICVQSGKTVVLFLDSWALAPLAAAATPTVPTVTAEGVELYVLLPQAPNNPALEETYNVIAPGEDVTGSIGHTVLLTGFGTLDGCEFAILQDGDHTTARFVGLPFFTPCPGGVGAPASTPAPAPAGGRSLWSALIASWFVSAPTTPSPGPTNEPAPSQPSPPPSPPPPLPPPLSPSPSPPSCSTYTAYSGQAHAAGYANSLFELSNGISLGTLGNGFTRQVIGAHDGWNVPNVEKCCAICEYGEYDGVIYTFNSDQYGNNPASCASFELKFIDDPSFGFYCRFYATPQATTWDGTEWLATASSVFYAKPADVYHLPSPPPSPPPPSPPPSPPPPSPPPCDAYTHTAGQYIPNFNAHFLSGPITVDECKTQCCDAEALYPSKFTAEQPCVSFDYNVAGSSCNLSWKSTKNGGTLQGSGFFDYYEKSSLSFPPPEPPSPPPSPPPPSPPLPPIRPSLGATDRTYATPFINGPGQSEQSVHGARCVEELTQDECRLYEERYAGDGSPSAAFVVVDSPDMPGPGCMISNQAVIFYYNTAVTNIQCGTGTASSNFIICVCVDKSPSAPPPLAPPPLAP